jgi:ABC-type Fe3+/spermidine/putrescine transport system ATPase subunit
MSLELRGLQKRIGQITLQLDFCVQGGETLVLLGPSGCGKTTSLNLILGLLDPDEGDILIDGRSIVNLPPWKRNISIVFQDLALFPHLNVENNVGYGLFVRGIVGGERKKRTAAVLRLVQMGDYGKRRIHTLSGGEKQRVALARALAVDPRLLLLDEPFSSLDAPLRRELWRVYRELGGTLPRIFVTHDREEAAELGDRIALLEKGNIVEIGKPEDLFLRPRSAFAARFLGAGSLLPCTIRGRAQGLLHIDSPLGPLAIRPDTGPDTGPDGDSPNHAALLFIPREALTLEGPGIPCGGLVTRVSFNGRERELQVELRDGTMLELAVKNREALSPGPLQFWVRPEMLRLLFQ